MGRTQEGPEAYEARLVAESPDEEALVGGLLDGQESAFEALVARYYGPLLRLAMMHVQNHQIAEEVVQETWIGVLHGLDSFERRSSLRTWIFHILANQARTRAKREARTVPFSTLQEHDETGGPSVDPSRLLPADDPDFPGHWASPLRNWSVVPEEQLLSGETRAYIHKAIDALPPAQREIITLRDIEGLSSREVCNVLDISEINQRVLLHRARSRTRQALEEYLNL